MQEKYDRVKLLQQLNENTKLITKLRYQGDNYDSKMVMNNFNLDQLKKLDPVPIGTEN